MPSIISFRIFLLCNLLHSILLYFVPKKLFSFLPESWFSHLPNTKTTPPPPQQADPSPRSGKERMDPAELKRVFEMFDKNGDGMISEAELGESLKNLGILIPEEELKMMIQKIDVNNDGCVDLSEFEVLYQSIIEEKDGDADMREAFNVFDQNGDGYITFDELNSVLNSLKLGKTAEDCKAMITTVDEDGDGRVNYQEFLQMMKGCGLFTNN